MIGTTKLVPRRTNLAASPRRLLTLSGFDQTNHAELILVLKWLPLMFLAYLPYHEADLWHKHRFQLFIKHPQSHYTSKQPKANLILVMVSF